jgi:hypothetical protein
LNETTGNSTFSLRVAVVAVAILAVTVASACGTSTSSNPPTQVATGPWRATTGNVRLLFNQQLGLIQSPDNYPRVIGVYCARDKCIVHYNPDEYVSSPDEFLDALRPIWKKLFSDPTFQSGYIEGWAKLTSVGGKSSHGRAFSITCDRAANAQIDWDNVDAKGMKALCVYHAYVNFQ